MNSGRVVTAPSRACVPSLTSAARAALYAALIGAGISLLFRVPVPALVDYPDHLARMWVLARHGSIPASATNYRVNWWILPDLAMDLIVPSPARFLPIGPDGRVSDGTTIATFIPGDSNVVSRAARSTARE